MNSSVMAKMRRTSKTGADELIQKACLQDCGKGRKRGEDSGSVVQLRIGLPERRQVVPIHEGRGRERSGGLSDGIGQDLAPGEAAEHRERQSHGGVQMRSRYLAGDINSHRDCESPAQSDVGEAAVNGFAGVLRGKEHDHGDDSGAEQNQHKGAQEFRDQFRRQ